MRNNGRLANQLRDIQITRNYIKYAEGSVLIEFGSTKVLCTATIEDTVPSFLKEQQQGWITAEYAMLPRSTHTRNKRDSYGSKPNSRALEISRLIGRSLRSCINLKQLGPRQILLDCDVIQADGGTRTASITGGFIALYDAIETLIKQGLLTKSPIQNFIAAISVGIKDGIPLLDLDYTEDSSCDMDLNIVMCENGHIIEIQGTAENQTIDRIQINQLLDLGEVGIKELIKKQQFLLK